MESNYIGPSIELYRAVIVARFRTDDKFNRGVSVILKDAYICFEHLNLAIRKSSHQFLAYLLDRCQESGMNNLDQLIDSGTIVQQFSPGHPYTKISLIDTAFAYEKGSQDYPMTAQLFRVAHLGKMEEMLTADNFRLFRCLISGRLLSTPIIARMISALTYQELLRLETELEHLFTSARSPNLNLSFCMKMLAVAKTEAMTSKASAHLYQQLLSALEITIHEYQQRRPGDQDVKLQRLLELYGNKSSELDTYRLLAMTHEEVSSLLREVREILAVKRIRCWWNPRSLDEFNQQPLVVSIDQALATHAQRRAQYLRPY